MSTAPDLTTPDPLDQARLLIELGCPVFVARRNPKHDPSSHKDEFFPPTAWQRFEPDPAALDQWQPGDALCLVAGHGIDAIDVDTKNGADPASVRAALNELGVEVVAEVTTPSGGAHYYVPATGIRSTANTEVGVDFKGRGMDGSSTGFVYLPGTTRAKYGGRGYEWRAPIDLDVMRETLTKPNGDNADAVATFLEGIGSPVRIMAESSAEVVQGEPIDQLPAELRQLVEDFGPVFTLRSGKTSENRSDRFHRIVAECREAGLTRGQTVTVIAPWCKAVGVYQENPRRVAEMVANSWPKVQPLGTFDPLNELDGEPTEHDLHARRDEWVRDKFPLLNWDELWADQTEQEWIAEPILPARRLIAIYSAPKVGKSLLMLEIAAAVAAGFPLFGTQRTRQARVLYVDFENDPVGDVRERLRSMGYSPRDLQDLCYLSFPSMSGLDSERGSQELLITAQAYGCEVVVIDTFSRAVDGKENENDTGIGFYRHTGLKLKQAGMSMVRLDHSGKVESKGPRGGSAKTGDVDATWHMKRIRDDLIELKCVDPPARFLLDRNHITLRREEDPLRHVIEGDPGLSRRTWISTELASAGVPKAPREISMIELREMLKRYGLPRLADQKGQGIKKREWQAWCDEPGELVLDLKGHGA
jgi:hypothetical protein